MSRYDWPRARKGAEDRDDPAGRERWVELRRTDFDPEGAHDAARRPPTAPGAGRGRRPLAPPSGRRHLWQPLGPTTVVNGQAVGRPRVAGRVNALAVHPDGQRIYAASANGGVWYSANAGESWRSLGGFAPTNAAEVNRPAQRNSCGAIRVVWGATEADDVVYVGTGEVTGTATAQPGNKLRGIGVLLARGPAVSADPDPWTREAKNLMGHGVGRIALEPGGDGVVAATTFGLFERPANPAADADWTRVAGAPFDTLKADCTDVLWTAGDGARPARLWVWVRGNTSTGLWVRAAGETDFTKVATPGSTTGVAVLAASTPPDQVWIFNDAGEDADPRLYRVAAADASTPVATRVVGVPHVLQKQGYYDIAITVHPTMPDRVVLGGCTFQTTTPDGVTLRDGAVVMADVAMDGGDLKFGHPTPFTMVGVGVHADVQDVAYSNAGDRLWASCDGGVFRSDHPTEQVGFVAVNDGLSIVESNYVACHPTCEGSIVTGLQDNGVITRLSNGVWRNAGLGDGGGVVLDPLRPERFLRQHNRGYWSSSDGSVAAKGLLTRGGAFAKAEFKACAFYSSAAAIAHRRAVTAPAPPDVGQIIVGTTRVWYTEDFGSSWVTLPTGTDPLPGNLAQDALGEAVTVCRWQGPDVAWVLSEGRLCRYARTPGSDAGGGPGTWTVETLVRRRELDKKDPQAALRALLEARVWTDVAVNLEPPTADDGPPTQRGTRGAVYLGTIGKAEDDAVDTLWWYDGTSTWHPTGLRKDPKGVPAPVTAIVCDPAHPDEVWVGTTVGVWRGERSFDGDGKPSWEWESRLNGLPEAAVHDLAIYSHEGLRLLRAAIAARGVWELRLDAPDVEDLTYLRAHDDDLRYRSVAVTTRLDGKPMRSWHGSPDVRPRAAPRAMAVPESLSLRRSSPGSTARLQRFQAALRSREDDPRVRATGEWDDYFNEVLRDLGAPIMASPPAPANTVHVDRAFWDGVVAGDHATAEPWGDDGPSEADLHDLLPPLGEGTLTQASCSIPRGRTRVDVVVHHRGLDPMDGANVRVTLLRWVDPKSKNAAKWNDHTTWFTGYVPWSDAVNEVLESADGKTTKPMTDGWRFVLGGANESHRVTLAGQTLDPTRSGIVTFDVDLSPVRRNSVVLFVAVIRAGDGDPLVSASLRELAFTNPRVAARSVRAW